ncbi:MAG: peptidylprolyl isomerase [Marivibrio sp.]|uniref:peptidylprolyl isomerase n=1 Tax=Marivibrio sp. TaxID=2039719 RepID=UPI0032EED8C8
MTFQPPRRFRTLAVVAAGLVALGGGAFAPDPLGADPRDGRAAAQENVLRIAAVVNGDVISIYDLTNRLSLVALSSGLELDQETQQRLLPQVMRSMIDEKLQLQAAAENGVRVTDREIEQQIEQLAQRNNMQSPDQLRAFVAQRGVNPTALRQQIEPQIAWAKYVQRRLRRDVRIGEDEIDEELARLAAVADQPQHRVYEIFLSVDNPDREQDVRQNAERLVSQIRNGADFSSIARSFSQSSTAPAGGDLGWVAAGQLEPQLDEVLQQLRPGMISRPIRTVAGYYILYVTDERIEGVDPLDATIDLAQMTVRPDGDDPAARDLVRRDLDQRAGSIAGCDGLQRYSDERGDASIARADGVRLGDLPEAVREAVAPLQTGQTSRAIDRGGPMVMISICAREEATANLPSRDEVANRLLSERLDLRARRELRDLRRAAYVDVRL